MELSKDNYDSKEAEPRLQKFWESEKIYAFNPNSKKKVFSIDTPPPTVSGKMHIGHAFSYSQQDFIARFRRMHDGNVFYPFGTDDNGLPTERLIEKINNVKSKDMSRKEFIDLCLKTLEKITPDFVQDWKNLAISADYKLNYSTIDNNSRKISQKSFLELAKSGRIYKAEFPTIWCPECQTSIAQAELEDKEKPSLFTTIKFSADGKELLIATTRPELIPACVAVFVNPKDKRYSKLIGKKAETPLFNSEVPILADSSADMEKGTGVLMICSYGDKFDAEAVKRHKLSPKIILNKNGTLNIENYKDLKIKDARKKILNELKEKNLIAEQKQITHAVNVHDKCGTEIEFLPTSQWFVKLLDLKEELIKQGKKINWHPEFMFKRYENWVQGLEWDWNISRERHFGIPIPVWECKKCKNIIFADEKELPVDPIQTKKKCPKCNEIAEPDEKVLDTWATSSLSPQIASSLIKNKIALPYSLRPQAHDIIRTWAFYTITKSYLHENKTPWENVSVSGFVTMGGEKMSKSKGNVIDPHEVLSKFSADSLRFWAASSKLGEDLDYQEKDLVAGQKTINKLWNAAKFSMPNASDKKPKQLEAFDLWIISKLNSLIKTSTEAFENYDYARVKSETENFFWHTFCDNYLEIVKDRIYNNKKGKESAQYALYNSFLNILKLFAPIMPHITEELYQIYFKKKEKSNSIHISEWPKAEKTDKNLETAGDKAVEIITEVRKVKSKAQKSMKAPIKLTISKEDQKLLENFMEDLKAVTSAQTIETGKFAIELLA